MDPEEQAALGIDADKVLAGWKRPVYMVHEHHSRSHHYDLRLEMGGVLRSWAVPKGLPAEVGVRRLAREVPDHALAYAAFEGTIAEGHYGAGKVAIWDRGTFEVKESGPGKLVVDIAGRRIKGVYHLVRTAMNGDRRNWLAFLGTPTPGKPARALAGPRSSRGPRPASRSASRPGRGKARTTKRPTRRKPTSAARKASAGRTKRTRRRAGVRSKDVRRAPRKRSAPRPR